MHVDGQPFLVTMCEPLQLTIQVAVEWESQGVLGPAQQGQLELLRSRGLMHVRVHVDLQSTLKSLATKFEMCQKRKQKSTESRSGTKA